MVVPRPCAALSVLAVVLSASSVLAGQLAPPPGPVTPTMKPLDAIEPRICINELPGSPDAMHVIPGPGNYYLTASVLADPGKSAILIDIPVGVEGHTIVDLNGFDVTGQGGATGSGFRTVGLRPGHHLTIGINGNIRGRSIISGFAEHGVHVVGHAHVRIGGIHVRDCQGNGALVTDCLSCRVGDCLLENITGVGLDITRVVDVEVALCDISNSGLSGLRKSLCQWIAISNCSIRSSGVDGIHVTDADRLEVSAEILNPIGNGITATSVGKIRLSRPLRFQERAGTFLRVANAGGHGLVAVACDEIILPNLDIVAPIGNGVVIQNALYAQLGGSFVDTGGTAIEGTDVVAMAIGAAGMPTSKKKKRRNKTHRIINPGGHGIRAVNCTHVSVHDLECVSAQLNGISYDSTGLPGQGTSLEVHAVSILDSGDSSMDSSMESTGTMDARACHVENAGGAGLRFSGGASLEVDEWSDDSCTGSGIEVLGAPGVRPRVTVRDAFGNNAGVHGIHIVGGGSTSFSKCRISGAAADGICNDCDETCEDDLDIDRCGGAGVRLAVSGSVQITGGTLRANGQQGIHITNPLGAGGQVVLQDCLVDDNGFGAMPAASGVHIDNHESLTVQNVHARRNAGNGLVVGDLNGDGLLDLVTASSNGLTGVAFVSLSGLPNGRLVARRVTCDGNGLSGMALEATTGGEVSECVFSNNGLLGLHVLGSNHVVRSNSVTNNFGGTLFVIAPGNVVGPLIDELTVAGNCNPAANYVAP